MTQDEITEIYTEVSNKLCNGTQWCWAGVGEPLQLFAKLVADVATAKERAACAVIAEEWFCGCGRGKCPEGDLRAQDIADSIRARGEA